MFLFEFNTEDDYKKALDIAKNHKDVVNEDVSYCVLRERGTEVLSCQSSRIPYSVYTTDGEMLDCSDEKYTGSVLYRGLTYRFKIPEMYTSFETVQSIDKILNWPLYVNNKYTKRDIKLVDHNTMCSIILSGNDKPLFIKTREKGTGGSATFHSVVEDFSMFEVDSDTSVTGIFDSLVNGSRITLVVSGQSYYNPYMDEYEKAQDTRLSLCGDFILSEPLEICEINTAYGKEEYRCFIEDDKVVSVSLFEDYTSHEVPEEVIDLATSFAKDHKGVFQERYVIDFANTKDRGYVLVEVNPFCHAGRYIDNDPLFGFKKETE